MSVNEYKANKSGWCAGRRVKEGDPLKLSATAAKHENVILVKEAPVDKPAPDGNAPKKAAKKADAAS